MSSRRLGPKRGASAPGGLALAARAHDRRPAGDHRAGAAVVADGQVAPVGQQRLGVGAEQAAEVRGVLERRVEVDVVGDLEGQVQLDVAEAEVGRVVDARRPPPTASGPAAISGLRLGLDSTAGPTAARSSTRSPSRAPTRGAPPGGEKTPSGRRHSRPSAWRSSTGSANEHEPIETNSSRPAAEPVPSCAASVVARMCAQLRLVGAGVRAVGGGEEVQEAVLALGADRVVEPGGGLERQLEVARGGEERRHLLDASAPSGRRSGASPCAPAAATAASVSRQPSSSGTSQNISTPARLERRRPHHLDRLDRQRGGRPVAAVEDGADARARSAPPSCGLELGQAAGRADEAREHPRLLARRGRACPPPPPPACPCSRAGTAARGRSGALALPFHRPRGEHVRAERAAEHRPGPRARPRSGGRARSPVSMPISCSIETRSSVAMLPVAPAGTGQPPSSPKLDSNDSTPASSAASTLARPWPRVLWKWAVSSTSLAQRVAGRGEELAHLRRVGHAGGVAEADLLGPGGAQAAGDLEHPLGRHVALVGAAEGDRDHALAAQALAAGAGRARPRARSATPRSSG